VRAARELFAVRAVDAITVENVTTRAGVAKGTFYVHFQHLDDLRRAVADDLTHEFHATIAAHRATIADPVERIATGCMAFIAHALRDPAWGGLTARGIWAFPSVAMAARQGLSEDLQRAGAEGRLAAFSAEVGFDIVVGIVLQAMRSASEHRLTAADLPAIVAGALRALGLGAAEAGRIARRVSLAPRP
jgi:AcrR family transcriptional regulator